MHPPMEGSPWKRRRSGWASDTLADEQGDDLFLDRKDQLRWLQTMRRLLNVLTPHILHEDQFCVAICRWVVARVILLEAIAILPQHHVLKGILRKMKAQPDRQTFQSFQIPSRVRLRFHLGRQRPSSLMWAALRKLWHQGRPHVSASSSRFKKRS